MGIIKGPTKKASEKRAESQDRKNREAGAFVPQTFEDRALKDHQTELKA